MTTWNAHQRLAAAIARMAHFERRVLATKARRTSQEKRANSIAYRCLYEAYEDVTRFLGRLE